MSWCGAVAAGHATAVAPDAHHSSEIDRLGPCVLTVATAGSSVASIADQLNLSSRQLHGKCVDVFGYGPRRLTHVLSLQRALTAREREQLVPGLQPITDTPTRDTSRERSVR